MGAAVVGRRLRAAAGCTGNFMPPPAVEGEIHAPLLLMSSLHIISDAVQQAAVRRGGTAELCDEGHMSSGRSTLSLPDNARSAAWGRDAARQRRRRHHFEQLPLYSIPSGKSAVELRALLECPWS